MLTFSDSLILHSLADGVLLVMRAGTSTRDAAERMRRTLDRLNQTRRVPLLGVVVNDISDSLPLPHGVTPTRTATARYLGSPAALSRELRAGSGPCRASRPPPAGGAFGRRCSPRAALSAFLVATRVSAPAPVVALGVGSRGWGYGVDAIQRKDRTAAHRSSPVSGAAGRLSQAQDQLDDHHAGTRCPPVRDRDRMARPCGLAAPSVGTASAQRLGRSRSPRWYSCSWPIRTTLVDSTRWVPSDPIWNSYRCSSSVTQCSRPATGCARSLSSCW